MKRRVWYSLFLLNFFVFTKAQQLPHYTQFIFNKGGYNPAANGSSLLQPYEFVFGARSQWIGMRSNPTTIFINGNYTFIPQRSYSNWHNVGGYIDSDQGANFISNSIYASYAFHLLISKKTVMSFGVHAGMKQFLLSKASLDKNDPAVAKSAGNVFAIPDIIPGFRMYNKKFFFDFSIWHITKLRQTGIGGQIGSPSKLIPHYYIGGGRRLTFNDYNSFVIAGNIYSPLTTIPSLEVNVMHYWNKRFAYGMSVRNIDFLCGIVQFRIVNSFVVGMAYDLSINKLSRVAPHTAEIMIGISPIFGNKLPEKNYSKQAAFCPDLGF